MPNVILAFPSLRNLFESDPIRLPRTITKSCVCDAHRFSINTMGRKLKGRQVMGKGLRGALQNHILNEKHNDTRQKALIQEKLRKENKDKSMKSGVKQNKRQRQREAKAFIPFEPTATLLLVGEGDFSFAVSVVKLGFVEPSKLLATSFDSHEDLLAKYPNVEENLNYLKEEGVKVLYNIDATDLVLTLKLNPTKKVQPKLFDVRQKLDYIMFNFPHTGRGMKDVDRNIRDHQKLVLGYFKSSKQLLNLINNEVYNDFGGYVDPDKVVGLKILLSVFEGEPYISWGVKSLARTEGYSVERSGAFDWSAFEGYHHKRTNGVRDTTKPAAERDARIYLFSKTAKPDQKHKKKSEDSDSDDD